MGGCRSATRAGDRREHGVRGAADDEVPVLDVALGATHQFLGQPRTPAGYLLSELRRQVVGLLRIVAQVEQLLDPQL